ncbi:MAG: DUF4388 domain-containing protein [Nannocystaceae bacterium]
MTIEGSLRTMPAADILKWIRTRGLAGRLEVRHDAILRTLETDGVALTWASSNRPADVLSQVLRARGLIDSEALERAAQVEVASGVMLGQALIESGVMVESQVKAVLESQIREAAMDILSWNRGSFRFVPDRADLRDRFAVTVPIEELLVLARALAPDWLQLRSIAPTHETKFWVKGELDPKRHRDSADAIARHRWLLSQIEADAEFGRMVATAEAERFVTTADLAVLVAREIIGVVPQPPGRRTVAAAIEQAARAREVLAEGDHMEALRLARSAAATDQQSPELSSLVEEIERALTANLARTLLASHRIPRRITPAPANATTELTAEQKYALDRVDGVWDLFSLITSSSLGEVATLVTYRRLDELGLIAL